VPPGSPDAVMAQTGMEKKKKKRTGSLLNFCVYIVPVPCSPISSSPCVYTLCINDCHIIFNPYIRLLIVALTPVK
jgi:hypothetical protein